MEQEAPWLLQQKIRHSRKLHVYKFAKSFKNTTQAKWSLLKAKLDLVVNPPVYQGISSSIA